MYLEFLILACTIYILAPSNVRGRVDYISNPKRQEHLYAVYQTDGSTPEFWKNLARENRQDFTASGTKGRCIEGRELIIALPENFVDYPPEAVVRLFGEYFHSRYGVECCAALHHNKAKTNYHIHLVFSEREMLKEPQIKTATRNMFYNEKGKHVRTKKEILDADGNIREGCRIIPKGEIYESHIFAAKKEHFKSKVFTREAKENYTNLINEYVKEKSKKLSVFQPGSVYLATKKMGKNNPKAAEIKADNAVRQEWNRTVDVALVEGVPEKKILEVKRTEITDKISQSIKENGRQPGFFRMILTGAVKFLMEYIQKLRISSKPKLEIDIQEFKQMENLKYRLDNQLKVIRQAESVELPRLEKDLKDIIGFFKGKEKKEAQKKIDQCKERIKKQKDELHILVKKSGYPNVQKFMDGYRTAYKIVEQYKKELEVWKQKTGQNDIQPDKKKSVLERLKENEKRVKERERPKSLNKQKKHDWLDR
ncbi:MobA/MobL family protein [Dorea formicigenerans]|uniref:MobA/MobL family protein n=1 Tax=Dorea formicigenerans TaxID=39486 RepID=UPI002FE6D573